ncbi:Outer membrane protein IcsA autotransporter precursor [Leminorella richardii]|uniref:Outer membrane protein IcsA autotransporter n=1 Tax=Leminorella richardii TaxID=158841 RepID=A0A2X4UVG2_9GAMM|nr:autotransporter-associated beta strand repeat-containing protein [Leminorella richardii]SQI42883.1 Outer membrane protein IcsA autotransporter precursor [Leminorella richardii]
MPNSASALTSTQYTLIHTSTPGGISGDFSSVSLGGASSSVDYVLLYGGKSASGQDYNVGFELTWLADEQRGNGAFTLAGVNDRFNVDISLGDRSGVFASDWDGKTLTKAGKGTLLLSRVNTYSGPTLIQQGTLETGVENAFGGALEGTDVFVGEGGTLNLNGFSQKIGNLTEADGWL